MTRIDRRHFIGLAGASLALPAAIQRAFAIDARVASGTIADVGHVVILMQENRSFDHYFGTMAGVRGFGDRFPIPLPEGRTVWSQGNPGGGPSMVSPFALNTAQAFAHMRVEGTPHSWDDAQYAWDDGRMSRWCEHKKAHAMGHFVEADIPFQFALANAFTLCEAYHCSFIGGTNTNRLYLWAGGNDGAGRAGGPSISNSHDTLKEAAAAPYTWTTYPERLEAAGVSWKVYEDMADNFGDNPLVGFKSFQDSLSSAAGSNRALAAKGLATQHLDVLRADVEADVLPSVSWVISPAADSEHPGPSSPAQGADYTARVLDCLTSNPDVWAKTVLLVMFDENDGFFDHVPPPAPPSRTAAGELLGASTVDATDEYHMVRNPTEARAERDDLMGRPYGLGPRVPLYAISPWSRGGWVNGEVFDHTSVIRFLEARFGVMEPNISGWRRAVCGDLTSCFDFATPNAPSVALPNTTALAARAAALPGRTTPPIPVTATAPMQASGARPSRALPYTLGVEDDGEGGRLGLRFFNHGRAGVVYHAYDRLRLDAPPRRFTVTPGESLAAVWPDGAHDVCVYGPNGFFRQFSGSGGVRPKVQARYRTVPLKASARAGESGAAPLAFFAMLALSIRGAQTLDVIHVAADEDYAQFGFRPWRAALSPGAEAEAEWSLGLTGGWYDFTLTSENDPVWRLRLAGRVETGEASISDPAMGGAAAMAWR